MSRKLPTRSGAPLPVAADRTPRGEALRADLVDDVTASEERRCRQRGALCRRVSRGASVTQKHRNVLGEKRERNKRADRLPQLSLLLSESGNDRWTGVEKEPAPPAATLNDCQVGHATPSRGILFFIIFNIHDAVRRCVCASG